MLNCIHKAKPAEIKKGGHAIMTNENEKKLKAQAARKKYDDMIKEKQQ